MVSFYKKTSKIKEFNKQVTYIDLNRIIPARDKSNAMFSKVKQVTETIPVNKEVNEYISYILEENPQILFINNSVDNLHQLVERDENGNQVHVGYEDYPTSNRVSISNSSILKRFCEENDISSVFVYTLNQAFENTF